MLQGIRQTSRWLLYLIGSTIAICLPLTAAAQLAPVMGTHYAARTSDTGFSGGVNTQGGYGATVPLDLPPAKGSLPVPLAVVYGGRQFGAAGLGWDVPLSYIYHSKTIAHHRPKPGPFSVDVPTPINSPDLLTLTLLGERIELVRNAVNTAWVGRHGSEQLEVRDLGNGTMVAYDGNGLTYNFSAQGGCAGCQLDNGNLFLLVSVAGPGGNSVQLVYSFGTPALPGGSTGLSIDLIRVRYNKKPTGNCFKDEIALTYDAASAAPLSMSMLGSTVLTRVHKLVAIDVTRAGNSTDPAACSTAPQSLRKYTLAYQANADTGQPQLQNVTMIGQQGTPERNITLPVATYSYGQLTGADGKIAYQKAQSITLPRLIPPVITFGLSYTSAFLINTVDNLFRLISPQNFIDLDGDGRPDLISEVGVFRNIPGVNGTTAFRPPSDSGLLSFGADETTTTNHAPRFGGLTQPDDKFLDRVEVWKRHIDMNGDGRVDFVDAQTDPNRWIVHLNAPDPTDPSKSIDIIRTISTTPIRQAINHRYLRLEDSKPVPLARITSVQDATLDACWSWDGHTWDEVGASSCPGFPPNKIKPEKTITEWEMKDINGDGYPDFIYNESPIRFNRFNGGVDAPALPGTVIGQEAITRTPVDLFLSKNVMAMINTLGVHLGNGDDVAFASPIVLTNDGCGVSRWQAAPAAASASELFQTCGLEDVNGDGLVDRVTSVYNTGFISTAALGTGDPNHPFSPGATINLPGPLAQNSTQLALQTDGTYAPPACTSGQTSYDIERTTGLRDLNGDGIPDYITSVLTSIGRLWRVQLGTGTGFAATVAVTSPVGLELSLERNTCTNTDVIMPGEGTTRTPTGLYDIDGDGQPEVVSMPAPNALQWDVYQLRSPVTPFEIGHTSPSVPSAGRLVSIDNGYGAITRIDYRSAKEDTNTHHNVPNAEIVVAAEAVTDRAGNFLSAINAYAYGSAEQIFDSANDRFVFPGYQRSVSLATANDPAISNATITDTYPLAPFVSTLDASARFGRYRQVGRVSDVTTLSGDVGSDAWALLPTNIAIDTRRTAGTHYTWLTKLLPAGPAPAANERCIDMMYPYDFVQSQANALSPTDDECTKHGFTVQRSVFSYRGTPGTAPPLATDATVLTSTEVQSVDDFGRITSVAAFNDLLRADDNLCVQTMYATPVGSNERVLNAPASRTVTDCGTSPKTLAHESWEYDGKKPTSSDPTIRVSDGFVTSHIVSRIDLDTFASLGDIRAFDATYDAGGNPLTVTKARNDRATQKATMTYDAFGLVPLTIQTDATNADGTKLPSQRTTVTRDPLTLRATLVADANGMKVGYTYDGFDRLTQTSVTPSAGPAGVLSTASYNGFAAGSSTDRNIVRKVFTDPVAPTSANTAVGRVATTYLDSLGRKTRTEVQLGADYANTTLIVGQRTYDPLGRVYFEADPFPSNESVDVAFGTTYYFNPDGTPKCWIRGSGPLPFTNVTDELEQVYPTCFAISFRDNKEFIAVQDAASLLSTSPQAGVSRTLVRTAIGRVLERLKTTSGGTVIERASQSYDPLGHLTGMTRYQNPSAPSGAVTTRWHYDSLGWMTRLEEADVAPQTRTLDSWGQITQVQWCDDKSPAPCPTKDRRSLMRYDALGRITHREDQLNNTTIPETINDYLYDIGVNNTTPSVIATNVIGRLAKATSPTSTTSFSYDPFGRINAAVFIDRTVAANNVYVEKHDWHGDGSEQALHWLLPDNAFQDERVDYAYDSAGRTRSVKYSVGTTHMDVFTATGSTDIDVFGRIRQARYGLTTYTADYAETGRRLLSDLKVTAPDGKYREIGHLPESRGSLIHQTHYPAYDPLSREVTRQERTQDPNSLETTVTRYDALGRFDGVWKLSPDRNSNSQELLREVTYDALSNVLTQVDPTTGNPGSVTLSYQTVDLDRVCSIAYGTTTPPTGCNAAYDGAGNMIEEATRAGGKRISSYLPSGQVQTVTLGDSKATFDYDAFGAIQRLTLTSTSSPDTRNDKHFGGLIYRRDELVGDAKQSVITRSIPGPGGLIATRHGTNAVDPWTFTFGDGRGHRFITDQTGAFVQDIHYQPYGEATATGAQPGSQKYANAQWNGGDALQAVGLVQLGVRLYDPVIGRFLSRDPVFDPANRNPYAFAANDPVNNVDPSGMDCIGPECQPTGLPPSCLPSVCGGPSGPQVPCDANGCGPGHNGKGPSPSEPHTSTTTSEGRPAQRPFVGPYGPINEEEARAYFAPQLLDEARYGTIHGKLGTISSYGGKGGIIFAVLSRLSKGPGLDEIFSINLGGFGEILGSVADVARASDAGLSFSRDPSLGTGAVVVLEGLKIGLKSTGLAGKIIAGGVSFAQDSGFISPGAWNPSDLARGTTERAQSRALERLERYGEEEEAFARWKVEMRQYEKKAAEELAKDAVCVESTVCELPYGPTSELPFGPLWIPTAPTP